MIVGTAGHIDHGKSALVEALTGRAMDRLAEERRRGITIDLNFAPLDLGGGTDDPGTDDGDDSFDDWDSTAWDVQSDLFTLGIEVSMYYIDPKGALTPNAMSAHSSHLWKLSSAPSAAAAITTPTTTAFHIAAWLAANPRIHGDRISHTPSTTLTLSCQLSVTFLRKSDILEASLEMLTPNPRGPTFGSRLSTRR